MVHAGGTLTGNFRLHRIRSEALGNERNFIVYLPPGYAEHPEKDYPVIYLQDGQNMFDTRTGFLEREWGLDETAERLIAEGKIKDVILVGVDNHPDDRLDEYTPCSDPHYGGMAKLERYGRMVTEEIKPFIDATYRTAEGPENTGIAGSSLGGLAALELGMAHPQVFGLVGALSPSLWWAGGDFLKRVAAAPLKVFMTVGYGDGNSDSVGFDGREFRSEPNGVTDFIDYVRAGAVALNGKVDLVYHEDPQGGHDEWSWGRQSEDMLIALVGR